MQLASDYGGLMPDHATYGDSYDYNGKTQTDFTYHHIVPENKLDEAAEKIQAILGTSGDGTLQGEIDDLEDNAKGLREETRSVNLAHAISKTVLGDGHAAHSAAPAQGDLLRAIRANANLPGLYGAVRALMAPALTKILDRKKRTLVNQLKPLGREGLPANDPDVAGVLDASKLDAYGAALLTGAQVAAAAAASTTERKGFKAGTFNNQLAAVLDGVTLDDWIAGNIPSIDAAVGDASSLQRACRDKGLADSGHDWKHAIAWNPGNIHRGVKSDMRIQGAGKTDFDALLDDGGSGFEQAVMNLAANGHFEQLVELKVAVDAVIVRLTTRPTPSTRRGM